MSGTNLLYSAIEEELRASVRSLLSDRCQPTDVLARCELPHPYDPGLWHTLAAELGVAAPQIPVARGGAGGSVRETAVIMEELGRAVAPLPYLGHAVLASTALLAAGAGPADDTLASFAQGTLTGTLTVPLPTAPGDGFPTTVRADAAGKLTGTVTAVADTQTAGILVVPALGPHGPGLHTVETGTQSLSVTPRVSLDLTRPLADVTFDRTPARLAAGPDEATSALQQALLTGAGLLASEQLAVAEWCLETTVAYLGERRQFGRPVGSFQAVKHRLADLWLDVVGARAAARSAADALATESAQARTAVAIAQSHCADVAVRAAEECVQLHGGIGMTWELPVHLYLKRAKADQIALGTPGRHRDTLARLVDLPPPG